jgi:hypothetical protein
MLSPVEAFMGFLTRMQILEHLAIATDLSVGLLRLN